MQVSSRFYADFIRPHESDRIVREVFTAQISHTGTDGGRILLNKINQAWLSWCDKAKVVIHSVALEHINCLTIYSHWHSNSKCQIFWAAHTNATMVSMFSPFCILAGPTIWPNLPFIDIKSTLAFLSKMCLKQNAFRVYGCIYPDHFYICGRISIRIQEIKKPLQRSLCCLNKVVYRAQTPP